MTVAAPEEWSGKSPAILLVHGFTSTPWELRFLAQRIKQAGFAGDLPLLPGHGTTPSDLATKCWDDWEGFVKQRAARLIDQYGSIVVVGSSVGGLLAVNTAREFQNKGVCGLVTLALALELSKLTTWTLRLCRALGSTLPDFQLAKKNGSDIQNVSVKAENPGYKVQPLRAAREILEGQKRARVSLSGLSVPLLALHGRLDRTVPVSASFQAISLVKSKNTKAHVVGRSGHVVAVDYDCDEIALRICGFANEVSQTLTT